jgi:hypothetical protein
VVKKHLQFGFRCSQSRVVTTGGLICRSRTDVNRCCTIYQNWTMLWHRCSSSLIELCNVFTPYAIRMDNFVMRKWHAHCGDNLKKIKVLVCYFSRACWFESACRGQSMGPDSLTKRAVGGCMEGSCGAGPIASPAYIMHCILPTTKITDKWRNRKGCRNVPR